MTIHVFLIDDNAEEAKAYKDCLEADNTKKKDDYIEVKVISTQDAYEQMFCKKALPERSVVCFDQQLQVGWEDMDGLEHAREFASTHKDVPLIIYSDMLKEHEKAYQAGAWFYIDSGTLGNPKNFPPILKNCIKLSTANYDLNMQLQLIDGLPIEFMLLDEKRTIVRANRRKMELRGFDIVGKKCYEAFHGLDSACEKCPAGDVLSKLKQNYVNLDVTKLNQSNEFWVSNPVWLDKAKRYVTRNFFSLSAYPIFYGDKKLIAEIAEDRTESRVIFELSQKIAGSKTQEDITEAALWALRRLDYPRGRLYLIDESNEAIASARGYEIQFAEDDKGRKKESGKTPDTEEFLKQNGNKLVRQWAQMDASQVERCRLTSDHPRYEVLSKDFKIPDDTPLIMARLRRGIGDPLLGVLCGDRIGEDRDIDEKEEQVFATVAELVTSGLERLWAREKVERHAANIRVFIDELSRIDDESKVLGSLVRHCKAVFPNCSATVMKIVPRDLRTVQFNGEGKETVHSLTPFVWELNEVEKVTISIRQNNEEKTHIPMEFIINGNDPIDKIMNMASSDPYLGRRHDYRFALSPIVHNHKNFGLLAVIQKFPFDFDLYDRGSITALSNAAAVAVSNIHARSDLNAQIDNLESRRDLHEAIGGLVRWEDTIPYSLAYLTANQGLKFNRALFLRYDQLSSSFIFSDGIGFLKFDEHEKNITVPGVEAWSFKKILKNAPTLEPGELHRIMKGYTLSPEKNELLYYKIMKSDGKAVNIDDSRTLDQALTRLLPTELDMKNFLAILIRDQQRVLGCWLVDKRFADHPFETIEMSSLEDFADEIGRIQASFQTRREKAESDSLSETLGLVLHNLRSPLEGAMLDLDTLSGAIRSIKVADPLVDECQQSMKKSLQAISRLRDEVLKLTKPLDSRIELASLNELIREVTNSINVGNSDLFIDIAVHDELERLEIDMPAVKVCLDVLIQNAVDELKQKASDRRLTVTVRHATTVELNMIGKPSAGLAIDVIDNGRGVPEKEVNTLFIKMNSGKPTGLGLGLIGCRHIARSARGDVYHDGDHTPGAKFTLVMTYK